MLENITFDLVILNKSCMDIKNNISNEFCQFLTLVKERHFVRSHIA